MRICAKKKSKDYLLGGIEDSESIEFGSGRGLPPSSDIYAGGGVSKIKEQNYNSKYKNGRLKTQ